MSISLPFSAFFPPRQGGRRAAGVLLALSVAAVGEQTEFPYAAGTDTTGRAQAVSNAAGRVMIESPEFPSGLWVDLTDEAGQALAGIQVEYEGRADSLVVIWPVDPSGLRQETLQWRRSTGDPMHLALKAADPAHLPSGLAFIDWRVNADGEELLRLDPVEGPFIAGWGDLTAFLQERWQGRKGRVAIQVDSTSLAVDLDHPEPVDQLVAYLQDRSRRSLGEARASVVLVYLSPYAFREDLALLKDSIVLITYVVLVPGSELEEWVRWALWPSRGPVTLSEADAVTRLSVQYREVVDVSPLAALTGLEHLSLRGNEIADVGPLADLTSLEHLDLGSNEIVDMSPLASLTGLGRLNLSGNPLVDLSPLTALAGLEWLSLGRLYGQIADFSPLAALTHLDTLHLDSNRLVDLSPLPALTGLDVLDLSTNWIEDITPLAAMTGLEQLHLSGNAIVDVSPLAALPGLKVLTLAGQYLLYDPWDPTLDIGSLASLTGLEQLNLASNELLDVGPLAALTSLQSLILYDNYITDLAPLTGLGKLDYLDLQLNWIEDISPLAALTSVEVLILGANGRIVDVGPLAALTKLRYLDLDWNRIEDTSPLAALTSMEELILSNNKIVDLSSLSALSNLSWLWLANNRIKDLSPLVDNNGLGEGDAVSLEGNPLSDQAIEEQIPALEARGVQVSYY